MPRVIAGSGHREIGPPLVHSWHGVCAAVLVRVRAGLRGKERCIHVRRARGAVYRVSRALGVDCWPRSGVSAPLVFDNQDRPDFGVSAGQYIAGLINDTFCHCEAHGWERETCTNVSRDAPVRCELDFR